MSAEEESYEVGYGKPPKEHQFKKGRSGNPRGRRPKPKPDAASVVAILDAAIPVRKKGADRKMSAFEVGVRKLVSRAVNEGDIQAALEFLRLCDRYEVIAPAASPPDNRILRIHARSLEEWDRKLEALGLSPATGHPPRSSE